MTYNTNSKLDIAIRDPLNTLKGTAYIFFKSQIYMCCVDIVQYLFLLLVVVNEDLDTECRVKLSKIQRSVLLHKTHHINIIIKTTITDNNSFIVKPCQALNANQGRFWIGDDSILYKL